MTAKKIRNIILSVSIPAFAISGILFLWQMKTFDTSTRVDASRFANFGAFISGILGTFFGGLSLVMIVFTYKITKDNIDFASFDNLYKSLNDDINDASINDGSRGTEAYKNFNLVTIKGTSIIDNINLVTGSFEMALKYINSSKPSTTTIQTMHLNRIYLLYYAKVLWPLNKAINDYGRWLIDGGHDDCIIIIPRYIYLSLECLDYLEKNNFSMKSDWKIKIREQLSELKNYAEKK